LKGTEIPLAARIFAVADVYDALTSARPYRSRWSHEKAQKYISSEAGAHFDPKIVSHFTKMMRGTQNEARSIIMNSFVSN
jgi:HD-GYP domain-containing protein (c-di-GMP phosphodiesterase class II)